MNLKIYRIQSYKKGIFYIRKNTILFIGLRSWQFKSIL
ncbi:hypothetical protein LEP1GSC036_3508 [Leptospira weilii str. 2006001853]|uniref:Uncharacterized protein n=3 Tax=Leptospira weilii TaxID=28184 RepID=A0A828Z9L0_9LEPT|nr:hypothetical protein LEP1GSC036_3508 [Leptospira weilii str. 2006001853]EMM73206.1 hypothetical protein LEP1GSC038_1440 [Leptospira weilii str. 2006001855]EMN45477.1 hypothetical protein LEP1GSC086_3812 [Leptospira weilii str. LNT 1234]EMN90457.1 hypothetical protein LEP1GSC108_2909 [Leptospira weilii str. UI 13098]